MKECEVIIVHDQCGDPCARRADQVCSECELVICDKHATICCDQLLCPGCLMFHKCRTAFMELTQCA